MILNLGTIWRPVVKFVFQEVYSGEMVARFAFVWKLNGTQSPFGSYENLKVASENRTSIVESEARHFIELLLAG
jgi:hypothetical protein